MWPAAGRRRRSLSVKARGAEPAVAEWLPRPRRRRGKTEADYKARNLAQAIKEVLNIDYKPAKNGNKNERAGDTDVAHGDKGGERGEPLGAEPPAGGEHRPSGAEPTDRGGGASSDNRASGAVGNLQPVEERKEGEVDEHGVPFVKTADGTTVFGEITGDSGLPAAPIKLSTGFQDNTTQKGYGLIHIEANHGKQIREVGFNSVEEFVSYVAKNYDPDNIRVGKRREDGNGTFLIQVVDRYENTLYIELSKDGSYWGVNSGGVFRKGYANKKETVAKTEPQQPNNAVSSGSSLSKDEQSGTSSIEPNGEPTVSKRKANDFASDKQEHGAESLEKNSGGTRPEHLAEKKAVGFKEMRDELRGPIADLFGRYQKGEVGEAEAHRKMVEVLEDYARTHALPKSYSGWLERCRREFYENGGKERGTYKRTGRYKEWERSLDGKSAEELRAELSDVDEMVESCYRSYRGGMGAQLERSILRGHDSIGLPTTAMPVDALKSGRKLQVERDRLRRALKVRGDALSVDGTVENKGGDVLTRAGEGVRSRGGWLGMGPTLPAMPGGSRGRACRRGWLRRSRGRARWRR